MAHSTEPPTLTYDTENRSPHVQGQVNGHPVVMLVDTGAAITLVQEKLWHKVDGKTPLNPAKAASAANGGRLEIVGMAGLALNIGNLQVPSANVAVAKNLQADFILGADILQSQGAIVDLDSGLLRFRHGVSAILQKRTQAATQVVARVVLQQDVTIPGQNELLVKGGFAEAQTWRGCGILLPEPKFTERKGVLVARTVGERSLERGTIPVQMFNPHPYPVLIYKGSTVGQLFPVGIAGGAGDSEQVFSLSLDEEQPARPKAGAPESLQNQLKLDQVPVSEEQQQQLLQLVTDFADIFALAPDQIGRTDLVKHEIRTGDAHPIRHTPRRIAETQRALVNQHLDTMLNQGIIEPSHSPWSSRYLLVKKKDGTQRFCIDFRHLNDVTEKDAYPLPRIDDTLDALTGAKYFSTLDLASGYWQVAMDPKDAEKTAFTTHRGLFQFRVMPFGLCNAPATFERLMEFVLAGLQWSKCLVYLDDIIVYSKTFEQHLQHLREVFQRLREAGLKLKPSKCSLVRQKVAYLGHVVTPNGLETDPEKTRAVSNFPIPSSVTEVRSFLGLASYYRRFVKNFAHIASPLHRASEKGAQFKWTPDCQAAFDQLKHRLTSPPILAFPSFDRCFRVDTDASDNGTGAVLSQLHDGQERVIAYASRVLTKSEKKWPTSEKEALALVWATEQFRPYLYGRKFTLLSDHQPLQWLKGLKNPSPRLARWAIALQEYDCEIQYRPGKSHANADAMSRIPNATTETTTAHSSVASVDRRTMLQPTLNQTDLQTLQQRDPDIGPILMRKLQGVHAPPQQQTKSKAQGTLLRLWNSLQVVNGLLYLQGKSNRRKRLIAPSELRMQVLHLLHDEPSAGHLGFKRTLNRVSRRYFWPGYITDVRKYCRECRSCGSRKSPSRKEKRPLHPILATAPFDMIAMDIAGPLTTSTEGNRYILVISDYFSK